MMKQLNFGVMRCLAAVIIGVLLMTWPEAAVVYLVIAIGAMFFLPSLFSLVGYFLKGRQIGMYFPIISLGSLLFGLWLMISPAFFVGILMYVLGAVLIFAGISQIVGLMNARGYAMVSFGFYVMPVLILLAGLVVLVNPFAVATIPFIILGVSSVAYGVSELVHIYRFRKKTAVTDMPTVVIEDATIIDE